MKNNNDEIFSKLIGILLFAGFILIVGGMFGWFKQAPGKISMEIDFSLESDDFYNYEEHGEKPYITVQDKVYSATGDSHLKENLGEISFKAKNYKKTSSDVEWEIEVRGDSNKSKTYKRSTITAGTDFVLFGDDFSLFRGENQIKVTAKNEKGTETFELVVYQVSVEEECAKEENAEVSICSELRTSQEADAKKREEQEKKDEETRNFWQNHSSSSSSTGNSGCTHYEYGKCWDELEDRAYDDGYRDAEYGGHSYYDPDCTGVCEDIYEDAYEEGLYDGRHGI